MSSLGRLSSGPFDRNSPLLKLFNRCLGGWIALLRKFSGLAYERLKLGLHLLRFLHRRLEIGFHGGQIISFNQQLHGLKPKPDENRNHSQYKRQTRAPLFNGLDWGNRLILKFLNRWQFVFHDSYFTPAAGGGGCPRLIPWEASKLLSGSLLVFKATVAKTVMISRCSPSSCMLCARNCWRSLTSIRSD